MTSFFHIAGLLLLPLSGSLELCEGLRETLLPGPLRLALKNLHAGLVLELLLLTQIFSDTYFKAPCKTPL